MQGCSNKYLDMQYQTQELQPPERLSFDMLHYADDILGHAGLPSHHVQVSRSQPCLGAQYRSMFRLKCLSISDGIYRSMEGCLRSTVESECRSMRLVSGSMVVDENRSMNLCCCQSMRSIFPCGLKGLQPPERLSFDMLHYADDILGHAGLPSHHVQVSRSQPCLAAQYRSMFRLKCLSISDRRYRSMEGCLRSTVESECRSMRLVSGSTVVDENRSMNLCCCRSMRSVFPFGLKVPNL
ncbi:hypothetical protein F2Q69_00011313 [Brassica cretica]|uniref:Uncharacterized protein n=1 Tax=Brassica cretica TaxID=69181 RepID=A0A8S9R9C8_BRACR|nr:hypothetical protein F2Q69_00011313 [Brassica cretica]